MHRNTFKKEERLSSKTKLDRLFNQGASMFVYPFKVLFLTEVATNENNASVQVVFTVPKRTFKHAVTRNLIRRRAKEAYRLNKQQLTELANDKNIQLSIAFIYIDKEVKDYKGIEKGIKKALTKLLAKQ
ncbi:MAG TPA: ribonuclease P protein component [Prolixibacteraceae bacterium]|nr:ribonuclease P protein component [Prolixibacteraceae bacterium]HPR60295.1 ribonuclease P protein component [Prolixibacteraceae bacterium]